MDRLSTAGQATFATPATPHTFHIVVISRPFPSVFPQTSALAGSKTFSSSCKPCSIWPGASSAAGPACAAAGGTQHLLLQPQLGLLQQQCQLQQHWQHWQLQDQHQQQQLYPQQQQQVILFNRLLEQCGPEYPQRQWASETPSHDK